MVNVNDSNVSTTQSNNAIYTATQAVTLSGTRISGVIQPTGVSGNAIYALLYVRHGQTVGTLSATDGSTPYTPEQDVLWIKAVRSSASAASANIPLDVIVKSKRKMMAGDAIYLSYISTGTTSQEINSVVTVFVKQ